LETSLDIEDWYADQREELFRSHTEKWGERPKWTRPLRLLDWVLGEKVLRAAIGYGGVLSPTIVFFRCKDCCRLLTNNRLAGKHSCRCGGTKYGETLRVSSFQGLMALLRGD